jgi:pimeloyl-ACP methyl ester carboxylesterase
VTPPLALRHRFLDANGLRLHVAERGVGGPPVLLLHGFLEHARAWDFVAAPLAAAGFRVAALDWRGHGDSEWVGRGGYYHFADYVADLAAVVRQLGDRPAIVAHSMGATAALLYAGTEPERLAALVCVDSLGPPDMDPETAPGRFAQWIADLERTRERARGRTLLDDAAHKLRERFPRFSQEAARHLALHGTVPDGRQRAWKFDPRHQTTSPQPYSARQAAAFWGAVRCPTLLIEGAESSLRLPPDEIERRCHALGAERVVLSDCGHHPHLERPHALTEVLVPFLRRHAGAG